MTVLTTTYKYSYFMFFERSESFKKKQNRFCEGFRKNLKVRNSEFVKKVTYLA